MEDRANPTSTAAETRRRRVARRNGAANANQSGVRGSMAACRGVVRSRARNFYYGLRLTPEPKRSAVYAVYAWMRAADDIADGPGSAETRLAELQQFADMTAAAFAAAKDGGVSLSDRWGWAGWAAFVATIRRFDLDESEFFDVIAALRTDLGADGHTDGAASAGCLFETMDELEVYCYGVASTVGVICVRIWGWETWATWTRARELAVKRGLAFQFTNVLRDIGEDAAAGRIYVPAELLETYELAPRQLATWDEPDRCAALVRELVAEAAAHYHASAELDRIVTRDGAATLWAMTRIYENILQRIEQQPRLSVGKGHEDDRDSRAALSGRHKAGIAGKAVVRSMLGVR